MVPKYTPYFDDMPEENYFGEFRELSNTIGPYAKKDVEKTNNTDNKKTDDTFNEFTIFPKD